MATGLGRDSGSLRSYVRKSRNQHGKPQGLGRHVQSRRLSKSAMTSQDVLVWGKDYLSDTNHVTLGCPTRHTAVTMPLQTSRAAAATIQCGWGPHMKPDSTQGTWYFDGLRHDGQLCPCHYIHTVTYLRQQAAQDSCKGCQRRTGSVGQGVG
jgi:hypothetical protein